MKKELKLSDVRIKLPFHINYGLAAFRIKDIIERRKQDSLQYDLDFDVYLPTKGINLQRPFVWTLFQKQELILSILKNLNISTMSFIHHEHKTFQVIDGKQRLSAWIGFCRNEFPIIWKDCEYYFKDLDNWGQGELLFSKWVKADVAYEYDNDLISDDLKIAWFELINFSGTPQDIEHLNKLKNGK